MAELENVFAAQPSALENPVPSAANSVEAPLPDNMVNQQRQHLAAANNQQPGVGDVDEFDDVFNADSEVDEFDEVFGSSDNAEQDSVVMGGEPLDFPVEETGDQTDIKHQFSQFRDFSARVKNAFTTNSKEKGSLLEQLYGADNVKQRGDKFWVKGKEDEKFHRFDPKTYELVTDTLENFLRPAVEEAILLPFEVGGAAGGTALAGPGLGTAAGAIGARAAATPLALAATDAIAEAIGIERDSDRSFAFEASLQSGAELIMPVAGHYIAKWAIPGSGAWKEAEKAAQAEHVTLRKASQDIVDSAERLENSGLLQPIPGSEDIAEDGASMFLFQIHPDSPQAKANLNRLKTNPTFANAVINHANATGELLTKTLRSIPGVEIGVRKVESLPKAVADGVTKLGDKRKAVLLDFKTKLVNKVGKNTKFPVSKAVEETSAPLYKELGFVLNPKTGKYKHPLVGLKPAQKAEKIKSLLGKLNLNSTGEVNAFINKLDALQHIGHKGFTPEGIEAAVNLAGGFSTTANKIGGEISSKWGAFQGSLREQRRAMYKEAFEDEAEKEAVDTVLDRASSELDSIKDLAKSLDGAVSKKAFVNQIFNQGAAGLKKLKAAQLLLQKEYPGTWRDLKSEYIEQIIANYSNKIDTATGWNSKSLEQLFQPNTKGSIGEEGLEILFKDSPATRQQVNDMITISKAVESRNYDVMGNEELRRNSEKLGQAAMGFRPAMVHNLYNLFTLGGTKRDLVAQMSKKGVESFTAKVAKTKRARVEKLLNGVIGLSRTSGLLAPMEVITDVGIRGSRAGVKSEAEGL